MVLDELAENKNDVNKLKKDRELLMQKLQETR